MSEPLLGRYIPNVQLFFERGDFQRIFQAEKRMALHPESAFPLTHPLEAGVAH